jgi:hypothetical protein
MKAYRVYALGRDALVVRVRLMEAKTDQEAISAAVELGWPRWQLWRRMQLIHDSSAGRTDDQPSL